MFIPNRVLAFVLSCFAKSIKYVAANFYDMWLFTKPSVHLQMESHCVKKCTHLKTSHFVIQMEFTKPSMHLQDFFYVYLAL